jgi:hypothetical protein
MYLIDEPQREFQVLAFARPAVQAEKIADRKGIGP